MAKTRIIEEQGIVVEKYIKKATDQFEKNGKVFPAQPEKSVLTCVSGQSFDVEKGYKASFMLEYPVETAVFEKAKYGAKVNVMYEMTNYGNKPVDVKLL